MEQAMKEALKLALEALWTTANPKAEEAITAIKAALAQQEPDNGDELTIAYMSGVHRGKELAAQPAQEPWMGLTHDERYECIHGESVDAWDIAEAVEAKLKEKNNG
jgi:hypothetical protein